jgi:hypothetical protein
MNVPIVPNPPTGTPAERLILTRERLRLALAGPAAGAAPAALSELPGVGLLLQAVRQWWSAQPLSVAAPLAAQLATSALQPVAQRHPYALVGAACGAGALVVWSKPWHWRPVSALVAGLVPQLLLKAMALYSAPAQAPAARSVRP